MGTERVYKVCELTRVRTRVIAPNNIFKIKFCNQVNSKKMWNASRFCVSSLRRGHANLLCIVPILVYVFRYGIHLFKILWWYLYLLEP